MPIYFLDLEAIPGRAMAMATDVASASVLTFVRADSQNDAESMARAAVIDHGWITVDVSLFLQPTEEQLSHLDENLQPAYEQALIYGIGSLFIAYCDDADQSAMPIEIYSVGAPAFAADGRH